LLDYLTDILLDVVSDDTSIISIGRFGQLNATYVQSNSDLSYDIYATLRYSGQYLPVSHVNMLLQCFILLSTFCTIQTVLWCMAIAPRPMNICRVLSTLCSVLGLFHIVEAVLFCMVFAASPINICRVLCQNDAGPNTLANLSTPFALAFQTTFLTAFTNMSLNLVLH